jgi:dephospho-CoA kinase
MDEAGRIDRRRVSDIVFRDAGERKWLEELLHPVANKARVELMDQASRDPAVLAYVWDSPLLLEAGLGSLCDAVVFVDAPRAERLRRVAGRGWDETELARRENVQMPLDKKREKAEYHLLNADASPATAGNVAAMLKEILERFGSACTRACDPPCACDRPRAPTAGAAGRQAGGNPQAPLSDADLAVDGGM